MNPIPKRGRLLFAFPVLALTLAPAAWADIIPVYRPALSDPTTGLFAYNLVFATGNDGTGQPAARLQAGNFVTLYDIPGLIAAIAPAGWLFSIQAQGTNGMGTMPVDNPAVQNVTFTYNGAPVTTDTNYNGFTITSSTAKSVASRNYTGQDISNGDGSLIGFIGSVNTPSAGAVPEPATLGLIGMSLLGLGAMLRRKRS